MVTAKVCKTDWICASLSQQKTPKTLPKCLFTICTTSINSSTHTSKIDHTLKIMHTKLGCEFIAYTAWMVYEHFAETWVHFRTHFPHWPDGCSMFIMWMMSALIIATTTPSSAAQMWHPQTKEVSINENSYIDNLANLCSILKEDLGTICNVPKLDYSGVPTTHHGFQTEFRWIITTESVKMF